VLFEQLFKKILVTTSSLVLLVKNNGKRKIKREN